MTIVFYEIRLFHIRRGMISDVGVFVDDVFHHVARVKAEHQGKPVFAYGHSMGGMIVVK